MTSKIAMLRDSMSVAQDMTKAHILFVPVPVLSDEEYNNLMLKTAVRLLAMASEAEAAANDQQGGADGG